MCTDEPDSHLYTSRLALVEGFASHIETAEPALHSGYGPAPVTDHMAEEAVHGSRVHAWALLLVVAVIGSCERHAERPEGGRRLTPKMASAPGASVASSAPIATKPVPSGVPSALLEFRARQLVLVPRHYPVARLAFGRRRIGQLTREALVVRDIGTFEVTLRLPLESPRRLTALADGSLLAAGRERTVHLLPTGTRYQSHGHLTLFANSSVLPDARDPDRFFLVHPGTSDLYQYLLSASDREGLPFDRAVPLHGCDHQGFTVLTDGSFICTIPGGLRQFWAEGKGRDLALSAAPRAVWRLLPSRRIDQVWLARDTGELELFQLGTGATLVRSWALPEAPLDIAARGELLAELGVNQPNGEARRWWLVVVGSDGRERFRQPLTIPEDVSDDEWVAKLLEERSVVLTPDASLVAVGGANALLVYSTATGQLLFSNLTDGAPQKALTASPENSRAGAPARP